MFIKFKILLSVGILAGSGISGCQSDRFNKFGQQTGGKNVSYTHSALDLVKATGKNVSPNTDTEINYFVSPEGSDDNSGTFDSPFKTIQKCADTAQPGSTCWMRTGTYRESIKPAKSGTRVKPIIFSAYKNERVTISGTELVENWTEYNNSIYRTNIDLPVDNYSDTGFLANQVFVSQEMMPEARVPNLDQKRDYLRPEMFGGGLESLGGKLAKIDNPEIPELSESWVGAGVWTNEWYTTRTGEIIEETADQLTAEMTAEWERGGFWFYLFGKLELLDDPGEWFYDNSDRELYLWSPDSKIPRGVEVKQRNFAFDLSDRSYVTLRNLNLFANTITTSDRSTGIIIDGITAKYVSHHMTLPPLPLSEKANDSDDSVFLAAHAHDTGIQLRGNNHVLMNSVIDGSSGNGVLLEGQNHRVSNNIIANTNYKVSYAAGVRINGNGHQISHNTIRRTGRDAISWDWHTAGTDGRNLEISYNDIADFGKLSTDLGGIYVCCYVDLAGGSIHHNWIRDAQAFSSFWGTRGIYLDLESFNSTIHHNVVWNLTGGKDNYNLSAGSPRGEDRIFNNTFLGEVELNGDYIEARNNIFAGNKSLVAARASNNLFMDADLKLTQLSTEKSRFNFIESLPDFTPKKGSPAIDAGINIPQITPDFQGKFPDIGAYEKNSPPWKAGSSLKYDLERN